MNGNITKEGIKLDLEWMHRVGIAGFQNFDAALATPQVVEKRLAYMTPEWKDAFKYAIDLGDQFGMEDGDCGLSGMERIGWAVGASAARDEEVCMERDGDARRQAVHGQALSVRRASPGHFRTSVSATSPASQTRSNSFMRMRRSWHSVSPTDESAENAAQVKITSSGEGLDVAMLSDGDLTKTTNLPIPEPGSESWIQFEYPEPANDSCCHLRDERPRQARSAITGIGAPEKTLEASDDGQNFRKVASSERRRAPEHTISFAPVTAKYFRVTFKRTPPPPVPAWAAGIDPRSFGSSPSAPPTSYEIAELVLHPDPRVNHFEEKAAFVPEADLYQFATPAVDPAIAIKKSDVIDLTSKMQPDGTLDWTPPEGTWVVLRIGYSLLGITNHPATPEATGLEVDKLDRRFVKDYFEKYLDSYKETVGADEMGKKGIRYVINDSWEAGSQNWTDNMLAQFKRLRGYDATPWLPVLDRASCGERRSQRSLPLGFPQDHRRPDCQLSITGNWKRRCMSAAWATTASRTKAAARLWPTAWK